MLILPIKRKWFEMIVNGEKVEEYREIKPYYDNRLKKYMSKEFFIIFRNGYTYDSPSVKCKCKLKTGQGNPKWGAEEGKEYYILEILEIIEIRNWIIKAVNIEIKDIVSSTEIELKEAIRRATAELENKMIYGG